MDVATSDGSSLSGRRALADLLPLYRDCCRFTRELRRVPTGSETVQRRIGELDEKIRGWMGRLLACVDPGGEQDLEVLESLGDVWLAQLAPSLLEEPEVLDLLREIASAIHLVGQYADDLEGEVARDFQERVEDVLEDNSVVRSFIQSVPTTALDRGPGSHSGIVVEPFLLLVSKGRANRAHWRLADGEDLVVGSDPACDLIFEDPGLPPYRVRVGCSGRSLWIDRGGEGRRPLAPHEAVVLSPNSAFQVLPSTPDAEVGEAVGWLDRAAPAAGGVPFTSGPCASCPAPLTAADVAAERAFAAASGVHCLACVAAGRGDFESIDDYAVVRLVASGGMGEVYLVVRKATGELAALKALRRCDRSGAESIVRFCREARTGHLLDHPNVIRYLDTGYARGLHYLVLEYGGGRTVRDVLVHKGRLGVRLGIQVAYQVSKALEHALTHDVVHRDIKPENILIDRTKTVRLLDLGLAKSMSESGLSGVTRPGTVLGSLAYSAPEQLEDARRADHRSDIYSLGVVLYEMVSGRRPIAGHSPAEIVSAVMSGRYSSIRDVAPDAPEELERILARAMARRPEDRYPDPTEMGAALKALYASLE